MNVSEIMTASPVTIDPKNSIFEALERMRMVHCHHLPVLSAQNHLVGIISEYDCQQYLVHTQSQMGGSVLEQRELAQRVSVQEVMSAAPIVVEPDMSTHQAARLMLMNNIRSLPVMRAETLIGIVTTSDLLIAFMQMSTRAHHGTSFVADALID